MATQLKSAADRTQDSRILFQHGQGEHVRGRRLCRGEMEGAGFGHVLVPRGLARWCGSAGDVGCCISPKFLNQPSLVGSICHKDSKNHIPLPNF